MARLTLRKWRAYFGAMSFADILEEVDRLTDAERLLLSRRLRARELAADAARTAEMAARLDRMRAGDGAVTEEELRSRLLSRGNV